MIYRPEINRGNGNSTISGNFPFPLVQGFPVVMFDYPEGIQGHALDSISGTHRDVCWSKNPMEL